ncbi:hypothetical protein CANCADRAFT_3973 [Tortispora caseinolytica NRRL Y-17796]|uniref:Large ribosomal subunit protein uL23m n=1 Tax=Tortispora caseinolytica NRRL Y-17796 TaxID=767744 RepID=A0A1E4TC56_9ASCO|nr:hypothetical protein CANCADRAFT_3973 [Tortispora caseinolytica NRRL Y-17796]
MNRGIRRLASSAAQVSDIIAPESAVASKPPFKTGLLKDYLPKETITLLHPNPRLSPYQAKFIVPLHFNKLMLRDYLWNIYGLAAKSITTQLQPVRRTYAISTGQFPRPKQVKKMTIEMDQPFIWPKIDYTQPDLFRLKQDIGSSKHIAKWSVIRYDQFFDQPMKYMAEDPEVDGLAVLPDAATPFIPKKDRKTRSIKSRLTTY